MCGRTRCTINPQTLARVCGFQPDAVTTLDLDRFRPSYNVSPGSFLPVLHRRGGEGGEEVVVRSMKWGLVPGFTKKIEKPDHYRMFNARSESVQEKASFRRLVPKTRCVVAVEGFYEWKKDGSRKQPYYIHFKDERPLVFAALYDQWQNADGEILHTFTILTTSSSSTLQWLHDRMPVIFGDKASIDHWLDDSASTFDTVLRPYEGPDLVSYPVTPAIGKTSFEGPECVKEIRVWSVESNPISKFFSKKIDVASQTGSDVQSQLGTPNFPHLTRNLKDESSSLESKDYPSKFDHYDDLKKKVNLPASIEENAYGGEVKAPQAKLLDREIKTDIGVKRDHDQMALASKHSTQNNKPIKLASKKKNRGTKAAGDGQSTLLSFFGRS